MYLPRYQPKFYKTLQYASLAVRYMLTVDSDKLTLIGDLICCCNDSNLNSYTYAMDSAARHF